MRSVDSSLRLARSHRLFLHTVAVGLWISGALWLLFHYGVPHEGEFGPARHSLEAWCLTLHGGFAVVATWTFGWLWSAHIVRGWSVGRRRRSGGLLVFGSVWLVLSGYLLYYLGNEHARAVTSLLHWSVGLAIPLAFVFHRFRTWSEAASPVLHRVVRRRGPGDRSAVAGSPARGCSPGGDARIGRRHDEADRA